MRNPRMLSPRVAKWNLGTCKYAFREKGVLCDSCQGITSQFGQANYFPRIRRSVASRCSGG